MKPNAVAIVSDARQFPAAAFLAGRLAALNPRDDTEIILFSDSLPDLRIAHQWGRLKCDLRVLESSARFVGSGRVSGATFYRLFVPELVGGRRLLYLDVDTYPESEAVWKLFDLEFTGALAAVRDLEVAWLGGDVQRAELERARHLHDRRYFNAGVLLIDCARYANARIKEQCLSLITKGGVHDQLALNLALGNGWAELSPACNMTPIAYLAGVDKRVPALITHFHGASKPWDGPRFYLDHRARAEIEAFIPGSPWPRFLDGHVDPSQVVYREWHPPQHFDEAVAGYLAETRFVDVDQGITAIRPVDVKPAERLP